VADRCRAYGLDLVWPFRLDRVNRGLAPTERLEAARAAGDLGLLIASTRYFWLRFGAALAEDPTRAQRDAPIDEHVAEGAHGALAALGIRSTVRFAHEAPPLPIQRIAELAGFARLSPARLSVHAVYGPWIALRAVAVVGVEGPADEPLPSLDPCPGCPGECAAAFERALAASRPETTAIARDWSDWLAVRDACPVGKAHRYSEGQIRYGYTKDREILARLVRG
jgi:methylmalonic aciduria homocystinuria type C protein